MIKVQVETDDEKGIVRILYEASKEDETDDLDLIYHSYDTTPAAKKGYVHSLKFVVHIRDIIAPE